MNYSQAMEHFGHAGIAKAIQSQDGVKDEVGALPKAFAPKPAAIGAKPKLHEVPGIREARPRRLMPRLGKLSGF